MSSELLVAVVFVLALLNVFAWLALRFVIVNLYLRTRIERDKLRSERDGWRGVAERALLVAQIGKGVSRRAAVLADGHEKGGV